MPWIIQLINRVMRVFLLAVTLIAVVNCGGHKAERGLEPEINYMEVHRIQGDTLFISIDDIEVRDNGNMIISESMRGYVTELSPDGELVRRIGRKGNGPGEFQRPMMIELIGDSLFLFDAVNSRFNVFDSSGQYIRSLSSEHAITNDLYKFENGFLNFKMDPFGRDEKPIYSFYDQSLNKKEVQKITLEDILGSYYKPIHQTMFFTDALHSVQTGEDTFLMTSQLYTGKIYEYTLNSSGSLVISDSLEGFEVESLYYESDKFPDINFYDYDSGNVVDVRLKSLSLGLFMLEDGKIVHYVMKDDEEVREIGIELFSSGKEFLGYKAIKTDSTLYDEDRMKWSFIKANNGKNTFYTNGFSEKGEAEVVVFKLEIGE